MGGIEHRPFYSLTHGGATARLWKYDACEFLRELPKESVDLVITSPPYFMGKEYDRSTSVEDFVREHKRIFPAVAKSLKPGGSVCWQIGNHVSAGRLIPLDALIYLVSREIPELVLRNRIVWTFGHGVHCSKRFSGRHETILWFTKGDEYQFDLDAVRVPQKYPGKRHYKGPKKGQWSGNPSGKNPGDVWEIPNVKAKHAEKTEHPCQFPVALVRRIIKAVTAPGALVVDPYLGSGTSAVAALVEKRNFAGCDIERAYLKIAKSRLVALSNDQLNIRPDLPIRVPNPQEAVAIAPTHFRRFENGSATSLSKR